MFNNKSHPLSQQGPRYQTIPTNEVDLNVTENHVMNQMTNHHGKINKWKYFLVAFTLSAVLLIFTFHLWSPVTSVVNQSSTNVSPKIYEDVPVILKAKASTESDSASSSPPPPLEDSKPILNGPYCVKTNGGEPTKQFNCEILQAINSSFIEQFPSGTLPGENFNTKDFLLNIVKLSSIYGQAIRLAFHDAGEVDLTTDSSDQLGSDGCLSNDPGSNGIIESTSYVYTLIEPLWQNYCEYLTRADFWVLIGKFASELSAKPYSNTHKFGEFITIPYQYGRKDNKQCNLGGLDEPKYRLPSGQQGFHGSNGLEAVFIQRMGLTMDDVVTLSGAHSVGRVHIKNSGYGLSDTVLVDDPLSNAWDMTPAHLDNLYFAEMIGKAPGLNFDWVPQKTLVMLEKNPSTNQNVWAFDTPSKQIIMLNSDMSLAFDFAQYGEENNYEAKNLLSNDQVVENYQTCSAITPNKKDLNRKPGCLHPTSLTTPSTYDLVVKYADNTTGNTLFLNAFAIVYDKMTSVGYSTDPNKPGKLGTLKYLTCV